MNSVTTAVLLAVIGATLGGLAAPKAAKAVLCAKRKQMESWWMTQFEEYRSSLDADSSFIANPRAKGREGALGIWREDALRQMKNNTISSEKAKSLCAAGILSDDVLSATDLLRSESEIASGYEGHAPLRRKLFWASTSAVFFAIMGTYAPIAAAIVGSFAATILVIIAYVDTSAHIAPFELSAALYPVAFVYSLIQGGLEGVAASALCAAVLYAALKAAGSLSTSLAQPDPVGGGDVRLLPACALLCGPNGAMAALVIVILLPLVAVGVAKVLGRTVGLKTRIAMGPYIALACMTGLVVPLA